MIKVAIFEDNRSLREGLAAMIGGTSGFECAGAFPNCNNLLKNISQAKPDVVLMDIELPGINGIEAVAMIREEFPQIKILMETIFDDDEKIFSSICAGAEGYILKHTTPAEIMEAIREIYEGGSPMTPSVANRVLKMVKDRPDTRSKESFDLSDREKEILSCLVKGMSYKMVADTCFISIETVSVHIKNIYRKLQVHSKSEAVVKAIKGKIV
ncbi:MAG TPA: response regulator transcription factor [Chitinophagaceae bacterium]|jgi:DNA-binding NarL/FixJ family response regulator|nr:response regulator transcription factor [Chitinophagaceae bacterium]